MDKISLNYIKGVEVNIDAVMNTISNNVSDEATIGQMEYVILQIQQILPYEKNGVLLKGKKPSEYMTFFQNKIAEYKDEDRIFENLRCAYEHDNCDLTIDYEYEDIEDIFEQCKDCRNIYDKFALAIFYKNMGPQYRNDALNLFKEIAEVNPSNPCMTPVQTLFYIAEYQNTCHEYIDSMLTYKKLLRITPNNPIIYVKVIDLFLKTNNKDLAYAAIKSAKKTEFYKKPYFRSVIDSIKI